MQYVNFLLNSTPSDCVLYNFYRSKYFPYPAYLMCAGSCQSVVLAV